MPFNPLIPQPADFLSQSQGDLLNNNGFLDTSFGIDHYKFSNGTISNGFHNKVTTPSFITNPAVLPNVEPTTTTDPVFFGFQPLDILGVPITNLGVLQYSRGPTNAIPTPVTSLHSPTLPVINLAPLGGVSPVLNFAGIPKAFCTLYIMGSIAGPSLVFKVCEIAWDGAAFNYIQSGTPKASNVGTLLNVENSSGVAVNGVSWTLVMHRLE